MNVSGRTTVSKLKTMFREEFGIGVRVYSGNRFAEDTATLASIRNGGDAKKSDFELRGNMKVGNAEKLFKDVFGITIQIEDKAGKLADNSVTIASLKTAKDVRAVNQDGSKAVKSAAKPKVVKTADKAAAAKASALEINEGDCVEFGSYYQENSSEKTPIEWLVLKKTDARALLISRYALDCKEYHYENADMTWEKCDLRKWLNGEFLRNAFTAAEQEKIVTTKLANEDNPEHYTSGGNSTEDRVFCLSLEEAESLFKDDAARKCVPTPYAAEEGAYEDGDELIDGTPCCYWWLRSPGEDLNYASFVYTGGTLSPNGGRVHVDSNAVRPALWVNQDGLKVVKSAAKPKVVKTADKAAATKASAPEINKVEYFKFGSYYQENSSEKTPIEWLVLQKSGSKVLLISRYGLDCYPYHSDIEEDYVTWEICDLRKWLNREFLKKAFTSEEQEKIAVTNLANDNNAEFSTNGGNSTEDRVFCLSIAEAENLFKDNEARKCVPTPYAVEQGAEDSDDLIDGRSCCDWWLRSPGMCQNGASCVDPDGSLNPMGDLADNDLFVVRPALWVNL